MLQRLRFDVSHSRGRRYPEPEHPYRNAFQRDRDRVIHARAFRRLEAKTQVFTPGISDHFRNRLTHTIEVAQIARSVARALALDEDFTEALALAHDIGHPPFSHAGETELDAQMRRFGERFDHNLHALRIVESFEQRYARFPGLNLTFELREGIIKHSRDYEPGDVAEAEEYLPGQRPPLEAQLIDLADEIAYNSGDLDDGFSAGMLSAEEIAGAVPHYAEIYRRIETQFPGASPREQFHETLRQLIDSLVTGLIEGTAAAAQRSGAREAADVRTLDRLAEFTPAAGDASRALKKFLQEKIYTSSIVVEERQRTTGRIAQLFTYFLEHRDAMPEPYRVEMERTPAHRVICDYIAGMTDGFFNRTWADYFSSKAKLDSSA